MGRKRTSTEGEPETSDVPLRGSREAILGSDGLRVSRASGTTPARAPDDSRPPAYGGHEYPDEDEAHPASREAVLGGRSRATRPAGGLAAEDEALPRGSRPGDPDPERDWAEDESNEG